MAKINFGGVWEEVITSEEFPIEKAREVLKHERIAILGYGVQGPGQALNLRDNGIDVTVGGRKWHGLDVCQLQHHGSAWSSGLGPSFQGGSHALV